METLVSSWYNVQPLPENYIIPPEKRPGDVIVPLCKTLPVIDLSEAAGHPRAEIVQQILQASEDFGFFQVINHGIANTLIDDTMSVGKEFFGLPDNDKASLYTVDPNKSCKLYRSSMNYPIEKVHYWRDHLTHYCHPLEDYMQFWPEKPTRYRVVVGKYSLEVRKLSLRILELLCEGLGLEPGYFGGELTKVQKLFVNHYPPCPDPSLTLGLPRHSDPNLITILLQDEVYGLQVFKDGQWIGVEPLSHAFVVNIGSQLQIISNGKLLSAEHRAVTNSSVTRTTIGTFIEPSKDFIIEPAQALVNACSSPLYGSRKYDDFYWAFIRSNDGDTQRAEEAGKLQA